MTETVKFIAVQEGLALLLTPDMVRQLNGRAGEQVSVTPTTNGLEIGRSTGDADAAMVVAERVMREDHAILRKLAE